MHRSESIVARRKALGWTQDLLAVRSAVSMRTVITVEDGGEISPQDLAAIERALAEGEAEQPAPAEPKRRMRVTIDQTDGRTRVTSVEGDPVDVEQFVVQLLDAEDSD